MEPISHNHLVHILKAAINGHGASVADICAKAGLKPDDLLDILEGRKYATAAFMAKLGHAMAISLYATYVRYSAWRFEMEARSAANKAKPRQEASTILNAHEIAKQIILANPDMPEDSLAADLRERLLLDWSFIRAQIAMVRGRQQAGDYYHHG